MPSNQWLDDIYGVESPSKGENWLDTLYPVEKQEAPTSHTPTPPDNPKVSFPLAPGSTKTIQGIFLKNYIDRGKEEYDRMQTNPIISDRAKDEIAATLRGYGQLATHPFEIVKGAADFFMSLPAFGIGIFAAGKNMLERMGRPFNLSDLYEAASEGMAESQKWFGREAMNPLIGPPSQASELVGATAMAPALALSALGNNIANRFEGYPNIQGAMRFAGDIGGLVALGKIYKGNKADVARKAEEITTKAADIAQKETLVEQGMDEALKSAQKKILETEKIKLENEAKALQEELNYEQMIKEDLYRKEEAVHRAKQVEARPEEVGSTPKGATHGTSIDKLEGILENGLEPGSALDTTKDLSWASDYEVRVEVPDAELGEYVSHNKFYKSKNKSTPTRVTVDLNLLTDEGAEGALADIEVLRKRFPNIRWKVLGSGPTGESVTTTNIAKLYQKRYDLPYNEAFDLAKGDTEANVVKMYREATGKSVKDISDYEGMLEYWEKIGDEEAAKKAKPKPEPITEVDELTDREIPELTGDQHPMRETDAAKTEAMAERFEQTKYTEDVELYTQKLINDMNRWLDGNDEVNVGDVRDTLSTLAVRADELRYSFDDPKYFVDWKDVVEEAANWARQAERSKEPLRKIDLQSEEAVKADLERIDALEKEYGKPIDEITDAEIEKFFTEREVSLADADWFGDELYTGIPIHRLNLKDIKEDVLSAIGRLRDIKDIRHAKLIGGLVKRGHTTKDIDVLVDTNISKGLPIEALRDKLTDIELDINLTTQRLRDKLIESKFLDKYDEESTLDVFYKVGDEVYKFTSERGFTDLENVTDWFKGGPELASIKGLRTAYHGTPYDIKGGKFRIEAAGTNLENAEDAGALFFSDNFNVAKAYSKMPQSEWELHSYRQAFQIQRRMDRGMTEEEARAGGNIYEVDIDFKNPIVVDRKGRFWNPAEYEALIEEAKKNSNDGIIVKNTIEMSEEFHSPLLDPDAYKGTTYIVVDTKAIKHAEIGGIELYSGIPIHKIKDIFKRTKPNKPLETKAQLSEAAKAILEGAKRAKAYSEKAQGVRRTDYKRAAKELRKNFNRDFIDRSGNIRQDLLNVLGDEGYDILQKMYLSKGASALSARMLKRMQHEVYRGLSGVEKKALDRLIFHTRMADLGKYKTEKEFAYFKDHPVSESIAYIELMKQIEKLPDGVASKLHRRAEAYFEWMKKPLKDLLDSGIISEEEFTNLSSHNYRRLQLVDIFDNRYQTKIGKKKMTVWDSGVQALAKGKGTDIFEQSSEIMALEVFNRAYGRVLRNEANKGLIELARKSPDNPFVRIKTKGQRIPSGWQRIFAFEKGERKSIYLSPDMAKEWITNSPEISYRLSQLIRTLSGSSILRTFATGINWGFALANLPKDVMHSWFAARTFENGKWKSVYNPNMPIFLGQMGRDLATVFYDAATRGKRYDAYIREGGGMEFLVHQGRLLGRGRRLETPLDKIQNFFGYFGETSEIMTRLAIRERLIRKGKSPQEATFAARDYMDFGQGGGVTKALDNGIPYLNASVVATRGMFRALKENKYASSWKLAQFAALTTGIYLASKKEAPKTAEEVKYSIDAQNNIILPFPDRFRFIDERNQERGIYLKIPIDPSQKFFKKFFEASADKWLGEEIDVNGVVDALKQFSPVPGVTEVLPPSLSGPLGYVTNKDFWLNEDIWRKTEPFKYPASKEEYVPGQTPQFFIDLGEKTGLSPERTRYAIEELFTSGTIWSYLVGKGYDELFADLPKDMSEQHLAMTLARFPGIRRFIGVTNPYTKHAQMVSEAEQKADLDYWIQTRELDRLANGFLFEKSVPEKDVYKYIRSTGDKDTINRLYDRYQFHKATRNLPERSFWLRLQGLKLPARAEAYVKRFYGADEAEKKQMRKEISIIGAAGGVFSKNFWAEVQKYRAESRK